MYRKDYITCIALEIELLENELEIIKANKYCYAEFCQNPLDDSDSVISNIMYKINQDKYEILQSKIKLLKSKLNG